MYSSTDDQDYRQELDIVRLGLLVRQELAQFHSHFSERPVTELQDLRAFFVAWMAVFLPEVFDRPMVQSLTDRIDSYWQQDCFRYSGWYKTSPLEVAAYSLTQDYRYLGVCLANIDHHNSHLRPLVITSLSLIANQLAFSNEELLSRTLNNLKVGQDATGCIAILLAACGEALNKHDVFAHWLTLDYEPRSSDWDCVQSIVAGDNIANPFLYHWLWILGHVALRLAETPPLLPPQQQLLFELPDHSAASATDQKVLFPIDPVMPIMAKAYQRMRQHPLAASFLRLDSSKDRPPATTSS